MTSKAKIPAQLMVRGVKPADAMLAFDALIGKPSRFLRKKLSEEGEVEIEGLGILG